MSDAADWKGRRLGAYQVGERLTDIPEDEDQIHTARHVETGEPALVVVPGTGDDWRGSTPWHAETTSFTEPQALVFHPRREEGTKRPRFHSLTLGYMRLAGALAQLDERAEVRAQFMGEPRPRRSWDRATRWGLATMALALGMVLLLWPRPFILSATRDVPILVSRENPSSPTIAYPMPEQPLKDQARPPCVPKTEVEIRGGCWIPHRSDAPCPPGTAEHQGKCFVAVKKPDPEPNSVQPWP